MKVPRVSDLTRASTKRFLILCLLMVGLAVAAEPGAGAPPAGAKTPAPAETPEPKKDETADPAEVDDPAAIEAEEEAAAVARPVSADPVQVFGWKEWITLSDGKNELKVAAKLDTGAYTSSVHAEEKKLFERDGRKWVRFVVTDPRNKEAGRIRVEAPLVRIARVKEPGGNSEAREVVRLSFRIGERTMKADFTLSDRGNMLNPALIGRTTVRELGWVDPSRAFIADEKVMR